MKIKTQRCCNAFNFYKKVSVNEVFEEMSFYNVSNCYTPWNSQINTGNPACSTQANVMFGNVIFAQAKQKSDKSCESCKLGDQPQLFSFSETCRCSILFLESKAREQQACCDRNASTLSENFLRSGFIDNESLWCSKCDCN